MSTLSATRMTSEQFLAMGEDPPGLKLELAHGEILMRSSSSPGHSCVVFALVELLSPYIRREGLGALYGDTGTVLDDWNTRRPDLIFVSRSQARIVGDNALTGAPELCVEVISPGTERIDREEKFALYEERGVKNYWIFDPRARIAEAYVLKRGAYVLAASAGGKRVVRFPPFPKLDINLGIVWPAK